MTEHLLVEQDPTKCLIGPELVRVFYACAKLATIQKYIYYASRIAMNEMAWVGSEQKDGGESTMFKENIINLIFENLSGGLNS